MGGDEGDAAVLTASAGVVEGEAGVAEVRLKTGTASGVLIAVSGFGVGERSPRAMAAERG